MGKHKPTRAAEQMSDTVAILVTLERATGKVEIDSEFSTPLETWSMLSVACSKASETVDQINEIPTEAT
jgi:hypothetical protein